MNLNKVFKKPKAAYGLALPSIIIIMLVTVFPMLYSLYMSFTNFALNVNRPVKFVGFGNYIAALKDVNFWNSVFNTLELGIPSLAIQLVVGLALALVLNRKIKFRAFIIALLVIPNMIAPSAAGLSFRLLYSPKYGPINDILSRITGKLIEVDWLGTPRLAMNSLILVDSWKLLPFVMLVLLAGLTAISIEPYESAKIDGANSLQMFRYITLPLLMPVLKVVFIFRVIDLMKVFDLIYMLTMGGPGSATETVSYFTFDVGFRFLRIGYAAAISYMLFFVVAIVMKFGMFKRKSGE